MFPEVQAVSLRGTLQSFPITTHEIQSIEFIAKCIINGFNRAILQLLQLHQREFAVAKQLNQVPISTKTIGFLKMGHTDLAQVSLAIHFFVPGPIFDLTNATAIFYESAGTTQTSARFITSWTGTSFHYGFRHGRERGIEM